MSFYLGLELKPKELILIIKASIVEIANSHLKNSRKEEGSFSIWDGHMKKNWGNFINPPLIYFKKSKEARERCKWSSPRKEWAKLNFDGAARGNLGTISIGCIINDDIGKWITDKAMSINPPSNN